MTGSKPPREQSPEDDTALLIAVFNSVMTSCNANIDRGLQVVNYFLVAPRSWLPVEVQDSVAAGDRHGFCYEVDMR